MSTRKTKRRKAEEEEDSNEKEKIKKIQEEAPLEVGGIWKDTGKR